MRGWLMWMNIVYGYSVYCLNQTCYFITKNSSSTHEIAMILTGIDIMIFGLILTPLVSSSKNLNNPALDAGNGAFFFLSAISDIQKSKVSIKTFVIFYSVYQ